MATEDCYEKSEDQWVLLRKWLVTITGASGLFHGGSVPGGGKADYVDYYMY